MGFLDMLFGNNDEELKDALAREAVIIDVRSVEEYNIQYIQGSKNIPVDEIHLSIESLKKLKKPLILFCASGMRSSSAVSILKNNGLTDVHNGRTFSKVSQLINS